MPMGLARFLECGHKELNHNTSCAANNKSVNQFVFFVRKGLNRVSYDKVHTIKECSFH